MSLHIQSKPVLFLEEWEEFVGVFEGVDYEEGGVIFDKYIVFISNDDFSHFARNQKFYMGKKIGLLKYGLDSYKYRIIC